MSGRATPSPASAAAAYERVFALSTNATGRAFLTRRLGEVRAAG